MLLKLLDAGQRLPVHVHPDREFARSHLGCPYGKTEAWVVLDADPGAAVHLGWREDVDPAELATRRDAQDGDWMLERMHRIEVPRGDGILVPAGTVHAIGAGVFVLEAQEPTDFSILLEWSVTTETRDGSHLGLGFDTAMGAVDHRRAGPRTLLRQLVSHVDLDGPGPARCLVEPAETFFRVDLAGTGVPVPSGFAALIVLGGDGALTGAGGSVALAAGQALGGAGRLRRLDGHRPGPGAGRAAGPELAGRPGRGGRRMTEHVVGLDVGSTYLKAMLLTTDGQQAGEARRRTPWHNLPGGCTETTAAEVLTAVTDLLAELAESAGRARRCAAIGISGMAEAGALVDDGGAVATPVVAWFDPRGEEEIGRLDPQLPRRVPAPHRAAGQRAGHLRQAAALPGHTGSSLAGRQWLNLPEYVAYALGGGRFGEPSLRSRTGLVDQDTGAAWPRAAGAARRPGASSCRRRRTAGEPWGVATRRVPPAFAGAVLTVAGHDHLVASVGAGCVAPTDLYNSMGTAEALVRVLDGTLDADTRGRLAADARQRRPAPAARPRGDDRRDQDRAAVAPAAAAGRGDRRRRPGRARRAGDGAGRRGSRRRARAARHRARRTATACWRCGSTGTGSARSCSSPWPWSTAPTRWPTCCAWMDAEVGPPGRTVLSGGWSSMRSVRRARARIMPGLQISDRAEGTAYGAALLGAYAGLDVPAGRDIATFVSEFSSPQLEKGCSV